MSTLVLALTQAVSYLGRWGTAKQFNEETCYLASRLDMPIVILSISQGMSVITEATVKTNQKRPGSKGKSLKQKCLLNACMLSIKLDRWALAFRENTNIHSGCLSHDVLTSHEKM